MKIQLVLPTILAAMLLMPGLAKADCTVGSVAPDGTISLECSGTAVNPPAYVVPVDPLNRLGVVLGTKNARPGLSFAAIRSHGIDLSALLVTGTTTNAQKQDRQRHMHLGLGAFVSLAHTNLSFGAFSVLNGPSFRRLQYGVSVRL